MIARERACGADWKADKAAGKIPAGMKWPQYWSAVRQAQESGGDVSAPEGPIPGGGLAAAFLHSGSSPAR